MRALHLGRVDHARERDARSALDVIVKDAGLVAIALEEMHCVDAGPVFEVDAALREDFLHGLDELVDEGIEVFRRRPTLAQAEVERIIEVLLVVRTRVEVHRHEPLRRYCGRGRVELELSDRNTHAVRAEVTETEDAATVGDANEAHILDGPIAQNFLHMATALDRKVHAARAAEDVTKFEARVANGRVVHDGKESRRIGHDRAVEERLIVIEQIDEVDVAVEIRRLVRELQHDAAQLQVFRLGRVGDEADEPERLTLRLGVGRRLVEGGIVKKFAAALRGGIRAAGGHGKFRRTRREVSTED